MKVLGNGEVFEFDTPSVLLSNPNSYFVSMVEQTGPAEAEYLRNLANQLKSEIIPDDEWTSTANETDPLLV